MDRTHGPGCSCVGASRPRAQPRRRRPVRTAAGARRRGVNALALWAAAEARGYPAGLWGTFRQWADLSGRVRRGERAATVVFWRFPDAAARGDAPSPAEDGEEGEEGARHGPWARAYAVFNGAP